jgi:hypothetical protein
MTWDEIGVYAGILIAATAFAASAITRYLDWW